MISTSADLKTIKLMHHLIRVLKAQGPIKPVKRCKGPAVLQVRLVHPVRRAHRDLKVHLALKVLPDHQVLMALVDPVAHPENLATMEPMVLTVNKDRLVRLAQWVLLVRWASLVPLVFKVLLVQQVPRVIRDPLVPMVPWANEVQ